MIEPPSRRKMTVKCIYEHGPMSIQDIRNYIPQITVNDLFKLHKFGYIKQTGFTKSKLDANEVVLYSATETGIEYFKAPNRKVKMNAPIPKYQTRVDIVIKREPKIKQKPKQEVVIEYTENTKYYVHEPKYEFTPYVPPKNWMECIR